MISCKVLVGPIATDREYLAGETISLESKDADALAGLGIVEKLGEVPAPKLIPQTVVTTPAPTPIPVVEAPVVETSAPAIETPVVETPIEVAPAPVVETSVLAIETPVVETLVVETPVEPTPTPVVDAPVVETSAPAIETPVVEKPTLTPEEVLELEQLAAGEVDKIVKGRKK